MSEKPLSPSQKVHATYLAALKAANDLHAAKVANHKACVMADNEALKASQKAYADRSNALHAADIKVAQDVRDAAIAALMPAKKVAVSASAPASPKVGG
jgi:hypothetical protein